MSSLRYQVLHPTYKVPQYVDLVDENMEISHATLDNGLDGVQLPCQSGKQSKEQNPQVCKGVLTVDTVSGPVHCPEGSSSDALFEFVMLPNISIA